MGRAASFRTRHRARLGAVLSCALACLVALDTPTVALAAPEPSSAAALARLFVRTCFRHAGNAGSLRADLADAHDHRLPDRAAEPLLARPGRAYRVDGEPGHPEPGHLVVLSFDDGWCGIGGTGIDPHALTLRLVDAMRAAGTTMRMMGVAEDGREQRYLLVPPAPAHPLVLLVLLQSAGHLQQASLFAAPLPPEAPR